MAGPVCLMGTPSVLDALITRELLVKGSVELQTRIDCTFSRQVGGPVRRQGEVMLCF